MRRRGKQRESIHEAEVQGALRGCPLPSAPTMSPRQRETSVIHPGEGRRHRGHRKRSMSQHPSWGGFEMQAARCTRGRPALCGARSRAPRTRRLGAQPAAPPLCQPHALNGTLSCVEIQARAPLVVTVLGDCTSGRFQVFFSMTRSHGERENLGLQRGKVCQSLLVTLFSLKRYGPKKNSHTHVFSCT